MVSSRGGVSRNHLGKVTNLFSPVLVCCLIVLLCAPGRAETQGQAETQRHPGLIHAERARTFMLAQRHPEAIGEWEAALKAEPQNSVYRNLYGLALQSVGNAAEARKQFQRALQSNPGFADAHSNLAYNLWMDSDEAGAISEFDRALRLQPSDPGLHLARGLLAASSENTTKRVNILTERGPGRTMRIPCGVFFPLTRRATEPTRLWRPSICCPRTAKPNSS